MTTKPSDIIKQGDDLLEKMKGLDKRMYKRMIKFLYENQKDGKVNISKEKLAGLEDILYKDVKDSEYQAQLLKYLTLFNQLSNSISQQQAEINQLKVDEVNKLWSNSDLNKNIMEKVVYDMGGQGIKQVFVKGLADAIRDTNFFNYDTETAVNYVKKFVVENSYTDRYLKQTVSDALHQFQGAMNNQIRIAHGFKRMRYVTGVIETSRPFCVHMKSYPNHIYTEDEIKKALDEYCPNGKPSETLVKGKRKYTDKNGNVTFKEAMVRKGSGMIEGTVFDNFTQLVGGHGCRHEAIWTR